ncbi:MAG: hypothetical protein OJI67_08605 [Prosthecobacter sp.]|nr:hypothetical protein [Prosthecobacter sp.]
MSIPKTAKKKASKARALDWKEIAFALARQVNFSIQYLAPRGGGSGLLLNIKTGESRHWKEDAADALELIPGLKVDREMMHLMSLPRQQREKKIKTLAARRSAEIKEAPKAPKKAKTNS